MQQQNRILVLGARGLVGSALVRELKAQGCTQILAPSRQELDLLDGAATLAYFKKTQPEYVFLAAAKVGGIVANNTYRADFIMENLQIQDHVFRAALDTPVRRFMFLGSSCIYPKNSPQPIKEEFLLTGPLEPTNEPYAIAKIAGLKIAENIRRQYNRDFISVMPTNLYGINDNFHPENSHVIPGLIARMQKAIDDEAAEFPIWGTGRPRREFLYVDDMASACVHLMKSQGELPYWLNIGTGHDLPIAELAQKISDQMSFKGRLVFDTSKPDGMMEKRLDVEKLFAKGWRPQVSLDEGLRRSIAYYRKEVLKRS
jgi:GDP-L-fucose synthase